MRTIFSSALIIICCVFTPALYAQKNDKLTLNLNYNYGLPLSDFKSQIVSDGSPRGMSADIMYRINKNFAAGLGVGFQDFYQKYPRALYKTGDNEATSAVLSNSVQLIPVMAKGIYYPAGAKKSLVQPYISAGAGLGISTFTQYLGEFGGRDNAARLALQGGAGAFIPFSKAGRSGFSIGADYNMIGYNKFDIKNFNNLSFKAGVYIPLE